MLPVASGVPLGFVWLLAVTAVFLALPRVKLAAPPSTAYVLALAAVVRLVPALVLPLGAAFDIESLARVGAAVLEGRDVYTSSATSWRYPYLPLHLYVAAGAVFLAKATALPVAVALKLPNVLADIGVTAVIARIWRDRAAQADPGAPPPALVYALHPIPMLVSSYHGQIDAVTLLFLVLAVRLSLTDRARTSAAPLLGAAILHKSWPLLLAPAFLARIEGWRKRALFVALAALPPVAGVALHALLWRTDPLALVAQPLRNAGIPGWWGVGALLLVAFRLVGKGLGLFVALLPIAPWAAIAAVALSVFRTRRDGVVQALTASILGIYAVSLGVGPQYLAWVVPFAVLGSSGPFFRAFTAAGVFWMTVMFFGMHAQPLLPALLGPVPAEIVLRGAGLPVWCIAVAWWVACIRAGPAVASSPS